MEIYNEDIVSYKLSFCDVCFDCSARFSVLIKVSQDLYNLLKKRDK